MSVFGPIVTGKKVEAWTITTLQLWFPTYLREVERQELITPGTLPTPRSYTVAEDNDREPEDQMPAIVVVSPGLNGEAPVADGDGYYSTKWRIGVGAFASALDRQSTKNLVRTYCAAVRAIMLHKQSLGGNANGIEWLDEDYAELDFDDGRTIGAGQVIFDVTISQAVRRSGGPVEPDLDPPSSGPEVETVIIDESNVGLEPPIDPIEQSEILTVVADPQDPDHPYIVKNPL